MKRKGLGSHNEKDHDNSSDPDLLFLILWSEIQGMIHMGVWGFILILQPKKTLKHIVLHYYPFTCTF